MATLPGRAEGELAHWGAAGRAVRTGTWVEQAEPTLDRIERALAEARRAEAAGLVRQLVVEAQEIHDLYTAWCAAVSQVLEGEGVPARIDAGFDPECEWDEFRRAVDETASRAELGNVSVADVEVLAGRWRDAHDRHLELVAAWVDMAVATLGEERLGDLWAELQADGIAAYDRYDIRRNPWGRSHELLVQIAIEGMHGHLGGPRRRGEVEVTEHRDRVELRFEPCGSGGALRARELFGVTTERHDFAWNELGVCHYCVHCCVLQQLTPIDRLGYPARVIDPPLRPGEACTWTVYRDPSLVPAEAYERVGRRKADDGR
jgi:hypothetical protein